MNDWINFEVIYAFNWSGIERWKTGWLSFNSDELKRSLYNSRQIVNNSDFDIVY